jgi:predicted NUDIX family NTP pyrophosphohydrolase
MTESVAPATARNESAGILLYREHAGALQVLLAHPGGPFWRRRDLGAWTLPKGGIVTGESPEAAARREFEEELGQPAVGELLPLGRIRQRGGKWVTGYALRGEFDVTALSSNLFEFEWPPRSGRVERFPEIDRAAWFDLTTARLKLLPSQLPLLEQLASLLSRGG